MVSGGPAHSRPYASTPAVPFQKPLDRDNGVAARDPDLAAKCILYCVSIGMVAVHTAGNMLAPPPSLSITNNYKVFAGLTSMTQDLAQSVLCIVF